MAQDLATLLAVCEKASRTQFHVTIDPNAILPVVRDAKATIEAQAASIAAKDKEIERLTSRLAFEQRAARVSQDCAEQAERAYRDLTSYIEAWTSPGELKLRAGEMTAQEVRTVQAVLSAILDKARTAAFIAEHGSDSKGE